MILNARSGAQPYDGVLVKSETLTLTTCFFLVLSRLARKIALGFVAPDRCFLNLAVLNVWGRDVLVHSTRNIISRAACDIVLGRDASRVGCFIWGTVPA